MAQTQNTSRVVYHPSGDGKGFTNENSLATALLTKPDTISPVLTHLQGLESDKFPLSFMSEGQIGGMRTIEINDVEFDYKVFGRLKQSDVVLDHGYAGDDKPGLNGQWFYVTFKTNWLKDQHTIRSKNGIQARIMGRPQRNVGSEGYLYALQLTNPNVAFCPLAELTHGSKWAMVGGASVSASLSMGNESNIQTPGLWKNQVSILRKSYHIAGNISNMIVEVEFNINGKKTNYWIEFEEWQHMINWKQAVEENLWYSEYNRLSDGSILLKDPDTGLEIPMAAGVFDQIPNKDTYSFLTTKKIKNTISDVLTGATDKGVMNLVAYSGTGGLEELDNALKTSSSGWEALGDKMITGSAGGHDLYYGAYFKGYRHVDGHTIVFKKLPLLDDGGAAESSRKHPVTGKPIEGYKIAFVDQSTYDGERNVTMVQQRGRGMIRGLEQGMSLYKGKDFGDYKGNNLNLSTEQDKTSIHFLSTKAVQIRRNTHCFLLECDLD